jgi:hypothetical protein
MFTSYQIPSSRARGAIKLQQFPVRLERAEKRLRGGESFCA